MRALVMIAPFIVALIGLYWLHRLMVRVEHRKLIAENDRLRQAMSGTEDNKAERIVQYEKLLDELLAFIAGFEGGNILNLSSTRTEIVNIITTRRPRKDTP